MIFYLLYVQSLFSLFASFWQPATWAVSALFLLLVCSFALRAGSERMHAR